MSFLSRQCAP